MKRSGCAIVSFLTLAIMLAGCSGQSPTAPSSNPDGSRNGNTSPVPNNGQPPPTVEPVQAQPNTVVVVGPTGCVDASELPPVVTWKLSKLPLNAKFQKAYQYDDTPDCTAIEGQNLRTQNDHLRILATGPTTARVEYDRDTFDCVGRQQVDVSVDGNLVLALVIVRRTGKPAGKCFPSPPPPLSPIPPVPPAPPKTPEPPPCNAFHAPDPSVQFPVFTGDWINGYAQFANNGTWELALYATSDLSEYRRDRPDYIKDTDKKYLECPGSGSLMVTYNWINHHAKYWWVVLRRNGTVVFKSEPTEKKK